MNFSFQRREWQHKINTTNFITFDYWVWLLLLKYIYLECFLIDFVCMRSVKRKRPVLKHYVNHNHLKRGHPNNNLQAGMIMIVIVLLQKACLLGTGKILRRTLDTKDFTLGKQDHLSVWDILLLLIIIIIIIIIIVMVTEILHFKSGYNLKTGKSFQHPLKSNSLNHHNNLTLGCLT